SELETSGTTSSTGLAINSFSVFSICSVVAVVATVSVLDEGTVKVDAPKSVESVVPSTEEVQEMIVSKPLEVSKEEQQQQESSP
ncbi:unnamed protein product, partial [Rotaria socialis]